VLAALTALLPGCASLPQARPAYPVTQAWPRPGETPLGRRYAVAPAPASADSIARRDSAARPLVTGPEAFAARAGLAAAAQRTLDLQYYIVRDDATTRLLLQRVLQAARRGVRVRLLVDDLDALGKDLDLATFAAAAPAEVRVFNPFATRGRFGPAHLLELIGDARRLNRRMHNKLWIADNAVAVVGGRNLGDEYFDASESFNFADLDVLLAGAAVPEVSASFDAYWNSPWALPVQAFVRRVPDAAAVRGFEDALQAQEVRFRASDYAAALRDGALGRALSTGELELEPATAEVFHDPPSKVDPDHDGLRSPPAIAARFQQRLIEAREELLIVTPYLIPSPQGLQTLAALVRRGVRVRVLTNSLASAEFVPAAHAGYSRHRAALARAGVELHEMRPALPGSTQRWRNPARWSAGSLHTKAFVVDRRHVVIGSMNLDPRSREVNTEIALLLDSPGLGRALGALFDEAVEPQSVWRVQWVEPAGAVPYLRWSTEDGGRTVQTAHEPGVGLARRALSALLRALAPEALL
jgi:putative cardiolipin synthase